MKLNVITASTRPGRVGPIIAAWFVDQISPELGFEVEAVDLADLALPMLDEPNHPSEHIYLHEHTRRWSESVEAADAFVLVMPEYNVGFNAPLKNALDYLYTEWNHKPVGFVSYGMTSAGLRAVEMLKPVLVSLKMIPVHDAVSVPLRLRVDEDGVLHPDAVMTDAAHGMLAELRVLAEALAPLRELNEIVAGNQVIDKRPGECAADGQLTDGPVQPDFHFVQPPLVPGSSPVRGLPESDCPVSTDFCRFVQRKNLKPRFATRNGCQGHH